MRRWWVVIALVLSLGMNVGILATVATRKAVHPEEAPRPEEASRPAPERPPAASPPPPATPAPQAPPPPQASPPPQPPPPEPRPDRPPPSRPEDMEDGPAGGEPSPPRLARLADRLGLEGEPRRRFLELQQGFFEETVRIRLHMAESQREARRELVSTHPDTRRIDERLQASARDYLALEQALAKNVAATREILTPRQEQEYLGIISHLRPPGPVPGNPGQPQPLRRRPPGWQDRRPFRRPGGRPGRMDRFLEERPGPPDERPMPDDAPPPVDEPPPP